MDESDEDARVWFRTGRIASATAPAGLASLGDRLVGGGHLSAEALGRAVTAQQARADQPRLGDMLVELGLVDRQVLRTVIRDQMLDSLAAVLGWRSGVWRFAEGETIRQDVPLGLGVQDAIMEAARRLGQLEVISTRLGPMDSVVDFPRDRDPGTMSLHADEWAMLTHIDGRNSIARIAERSGYGRFEAARIIYGLLCAGVVVRVGGAPPTGTSTSTSPSGAEEGRPADGIGGLMEQLDDLEDLQSTEGPSTPPPAGSGYSSLATDLTALLADADDDDHGGAAEQRDRDRR